MERSHHRPAEAPEVAFERVADVAGRLERELAKAVVGQHRVVREILVAFLAGGHCLLRGVPGLAKTLLIKKLAEAVELKFNRIQFTPDLMPSDIVGAEVLAIAADRLDSLVAQLDALPRGETSVVKHPLRSPWWMVTFAAALFAEWLLRRRQALR